MKSSTDEEQRVIACDTEDDIGEQVSVEFCKKASISVLGISDTGVRSVSNKEIVEYLMSQKVLLGETDTDYIISTTYEGSEYIIKCKGGSKEYRIPYGIEGINETAFMWCEGIEKVVLPETVTHIAERAFCYCTSLKIVEVPSKLVRIDSWAFAYAHKELCFVCRNGVNSFIKHYAPSNHIKIVEL